VNFKYVFCLSIIIIILLAAVGNISDKKYNAKKLNKNNKTYEAVGPPVNLSDSMINNSLMFPNISLIKDNIILESILISKLYQKL